MLDLIYGQKPYGYKLTLFINKYINDEIYKKI